MTRGKRNDPILVGTGDSPGVGAARVAELRAMHVDGTLPAHVSAVLVRRVRRVPVPLTGALVVAGLIVRRIARRAQRKGNT